VNDLKGDPQCRRYSDVIDAQPALMRAIVKFFAEPDNQGRTIESELLHDRPPLAGVVRLLEDDPVVGRDLEATPGHEATRVHQFVGIVTRVTMDKLGFSTTGRKGLLGQRVAVPCCLPRATVA
jgi:hypothetical protein